MTSCTGSVRGGFWGFAVRRRRVTFVSSQWPCGGCHTCWGGGRWKSQHRKIVPLSLYVEKPLNSKVIKSFVPELRSRKCFSCFGIPMFYVYVIYTNIMNVLRTGMNMSISRIHVWLCPNVNSDKKEFVYFNQNITISSLNDKPLKFVD